MKNALKPKSKTAASKAKPKPKSAAKKVVAKTAANRPAKRALAPTQQTPPDLLLVLEGLFLLNWTKDGLQILIPAVHEHVVEVAQTPDFSRRGRKSLPPSPACKLTNLVAGGFQLSPQFHDNHFSFRGVDMADNPVAHAVIADLPRPDAVYGGERYEVDRKLMLDGMPDDMLLTNARMVRFCEQTVLEYRTTGKAELISGDCRFSPVMLNGRQVLSIYAEPHSDHARGGHGANGFNSLLKKKADGSQPRFALTRLHPDQTRQIAPDAAIAAFGLPATFAAQIDGTGCGAGSRGDGG